MVCTGIGCEWFAGFVFKLAACSIDNSCESFGIAANCSPVVNLCDSFGFVLISLRIVLIGDGSGGLLATIRVGYRRRLSTIDWVLLGLVSFGIGMG
nr:hypothetical protein CFP56_51593 [Quercus suber]